MFSSLIVAGVDVGGRTKGFHAVALRDGAYLENFNSRHAADIAAWCRRIAACVIGVDAPCRWRPTGRARAAERELMAEKIWCFSTPTQATAETHPKDQFRWMLNGAELFATLESTHPLFTGKPRQSPQRLCFETFPHAIACALAGTTLLAKQKRTDRRTLLEKAGVNTRDLTNIDFIDAALCALAGHYLTRKSYKQYGDGTTGHIIVPR